MYKISVTCKIWIWVKGFYSRERLPVFGPLNRLPFKESLVHRVCDFFLQQICPHTKLSSWWLSLHFVIFKSPTPQMNDTATPFGLLGRMCFQKLPIPSLNVTLNTTAIQKQPFLGLCACNLKQRSRTILFDHRKKHASTPWINQAFSSPIVQDSPRPISPSLHRYLLN